MGEKEKWKQFVLYEERQNCRREGSWKQPDVRGLHCQLRSWWYLWCHRGPYLGRWTFCIRDLCQCPWWCGHPWSGCHLMPFNVWVLFWAGPTTREPPHSSTSGDMSTCLCSWGELASDAWVEELTSWLSRGELFCPSSWQCRGAGPVGTDVEELALMMWTQERQPHPSTVHYGRAGPGYMGKGEVLSWPTQAPPRPRSVALSWLNPTPTPCMSCWS